MISDKLFEHAFTYKKTRLWETLWDSEIFAVKLSDGRIGYISIMGAAGKHCALGLYIGSGGLDSFRSMAKADEFFMSSFEFHEQLMQQDCLQCSFEPRDNLSVEEQEEAKKYARSRKIKLAGKNAYPQFTRYRPNRYPWHLQTEEEQEMLCEALAAATALAGFLEERKPKEIGLAAINEWEQEIPMLEFRDGAYVLTKTVIPEERLPEPPAPKAGNEVGLAKLKKIKKAGVWECEIARVPEPVRDEEEEVPFFPALFLAVESSSQYVLPLPSVKDYEEKPEELLDIVIGGLLKQNRCPKKIMARDQRTYSFLKDFCEKLKITLEVGEDLEALDEAEALLLDRLEMSEEEEMEELFGAVDLLLDMADGQLQDLPEEILRQFEILLEHGVLPEGMEEKVKRVLDRAKGGGVSGKKVTSNNIRAISPAQSYVISVSLGTGCYRHIQAPGNCTLLALHRAILDTFGFDDDHAHAFFMDNRSWSDYDSYYAEGVESGLRTTGRYRLNQVGLQQGKQFKYIYDFGDEWTFQCKVLKVLEGNVPGITVIRSKGEAPSQYGDWEDDGWDDEGDDE